MIVDLITSTIMKETGRGFHLRAEVPPKCTRYRIERTLDSCINNGAKFSNAQNSGWWLSHPFQKYPPTPWSLEAKGKARGEAVHGRDTKVRHELSPEVQANRGSGASVSQRF